MEEKHRCNVERALSGLQLNVQAVQVRIFLRLSPEAFMLNTRHSALQVAQSETQLQVGLGLQNVRGDIHGAADRIQDDLVIIRRDVREVPSCLLTLQQSHDKLHLVIESIELRHVRSLCSVVRFFRSVH